MITIRKQVEVEVTTLVVTAKVRYWDDATVNGEEDETGNKIPCRIGDYWRPEIDLATGQIKNWTQGKAASIHYKVCDAGVYDLLDGKGNSIIKIEGYVPSILCPAENGYGDYIIMEIDASGFISNWVVDLKEFEPEPED